MRALAVDDFGAPARIVEVPDPVPAGDEVVVRVAASSINGFDDAVAAGWTKGLLEHRFPVVLGKDFAGTVVATGHDVTRFAAGDRVFGMVMKPVLGDGALGELVAVGEQYAVAALPDGLDFATAGALSLAGSMAVTCLDFLAVGDGSTILISGATGGVGCLALQLAARAGATAIATATPGERAEFVRELSAAHVVDYTADVGAQVRALAPGGVDAVLHLAGDAAALAGLLAPGGRLASGRGFGPEVAERDDVVASLVVADPTPAVLDRLAADVASGALRVPITRTYPFDRAADALHHFRTGKTGKIAVTFG